MTEKRESLNRTVADVIKDDNRLSKHSSITSEVDLVVAETSISEAKVESLSKETFIVLEPGTTMKLSIETVKNVEEGKKNEDEKDTVIKTSTGSNEMKEKYVTQVKILPETTETENEQKNMADRVEKQIESLNDSMVNKNETPREHCETQSDQEQKTESNDISSNNRECSKDKSDEKNAVNDTKETSDVKVKEQKNENSKELELSEAQIDQMVELKEKEIEATNMENQNESSKVNNIEVTNDKKDEPKAKASNSSEQNQYSTALVPVDEMRATTVILPETIALVAKQLTTTLAKQMVETTTHLGREMIGAVDNLTVFNGSTLELADIDYFVIYKADNPVMDDGIKFIARMELGTNAITKVIPFSATKAWVSYFGGGIKLIDIEKECTLNKIDLPGLDSIATTGENYLFTSSCLTHYVIDKMHVVGEGEIGTMPYVKFSKSRIACMTMSNVGDKMMVCIEKRHSFLCFPGKSEINVQIYGLRGKRLKELRPKVDGNNLRATCGFPIGMCENTNGDICISSFNSADHTCAVEVFDKNLERRFVYKGDKNQTQKFMCEDICTDNAGNILMLDNSLKSVHVVNNNGDLIKMIYTPKFQIENPKCINVDPSGRLWIGQGPPSAMIIVEYNL